MILQDAGWAMSRRHSWTRRAVRVHVRALPPARPKRQNDVEAGLCLCTAWRWTHDCVARITDSRRRRLVAHLIDRSPSAAAFARPRVQTAWRPAGGAASAHAWGPRHLLLGATPARLTSQPRSSGTPAAAAAATVESAVTPASAADGRPPPTARTAAAVAGPPARSKAAAAVAAQAAAVAPLASGGRSPASSSAPMWRRSSGGGMPTCPARSTPAACLFPGKCCPARGPSPRRGRPRRSPCTSG
mmetsp:Transcript_37016/g.105287  ORF Transcript_37016/g.105287 Transcript_37016/m.105287 type:complete len:244 (-) Transcript_37016:400-1131(-)